MTHIKNVLAIWTTAPVLIFCASTAWAEAQWWDWEYQGDVPLADAHPALWLTDHPPYSYFTDLDGREELSYWEGIFVRRPTTTSDEWGNIVDCPGCIGGKRFSQTTDHTWDGLLIRSVEPTRAGWTKAQGFWPTATDEGCNGQVDTSPYPHFGEAGWHIPATNIGNPNCFAGGATVEVRYRWTGDPTQAYSISPGGPECVDGSAGAMPNAYPASGKNPALMRTDTVKGDFIQFSMGVGGERPEIDIGDEWIVMRWVINSSWEGLDYYVHDDGSLEPGTEATRGAAWDSDGPLRNELQRILTMPNMAFGHPSQDNKGWKGGETGSANGMFLMGGGTADFDVDYIRWAFGNRVPPRGDVDQDGDFDVDDLAAIEAAIGSSDAAADLDNNGIVDQEDIRLWLGLVPTVPGDFNFQGDGLLDGTEVVDIEDFGVLAGGFGGLDVGYFDGDANGDGVVDIEDFAILAGNFGFTGLPVTQPASASGQTSPEPTTLSLLAVGVLTICRRRRR